MWANSNKFFYQIGNSDTETLWIKCIEFDSSQDQIKPNLSGTSWVDGFRLAYSRLSLRYVGSLRIGLLYNISLVMWKKKILKFCQSQYLKFSCSSLVTKDKNWLVDKYLYLKMVNTDFVFTNLRTIVRTLKRVWIWSRA